MKKTYYKKAKKLQDELSVLLIKVEEFKDEVEEYFNEKPENWKGGEKGEHTDQCINQLGSTCEFIESAIECLDEVDEQ
ncbi:hypothetical protein [Xenorhabdus bovienii]|uniref:hypothetical protein n=1 Tax=Xenorhabdus bovienii TaxID=40576 RepID=UPI0023B25012|nr:hypothetical protein [Xenorhabdus bovienii]MDE9544181.1 hypothetical protein [Xenorhabdus bovienii]